MKLLQGLVACAALAVSSVPALAQGDVATLQKGNATYQYWCATCHGKGPGQPGTTALAAKYKGALPALLEERIDLTPQAVRFAVRNGTSIMPFFRKTELSDADLDAVVQYLARPAGAGPLTETRIRSTDRRDPIGKEEAK
jgi:mono/diheme cytochrome c family protein